MTTSISTGLIGELASLLDRRHAEHLLPGLTTALAAHTQHAPTDTTGRPVLVDVALVARLHRLLTVAARAELLPHVLDVASPYLATANTAGPAVRLVAAGPAGDLTDREMQVLQLIAAGDTAEAAGRHLFLTVNTVKTHLRNLYAKLGAKSGPHAVHVAHQRGYLTARPAEAAAS